MKIKENKKLLILIGSFIVYMLFWVFFTIPLNNKNQELESKKMDMLIAKEEQKYATTISQRKKENGDDLVLLLQKNLNKIVEVKHIDRKEVVEDQRNVEQIKVILYSGVKDIDKVEQKIKEMELDRNIESLEVLNQEQKNDKKLQYSITLNVE